jgi:hypothetical protein
MFFFYIMESDPYSPRFKSNVNTNIFYVASTFAILVNLFAFSQIFNHLAHPAGHYFLGLGFVLLLPLYYTLFTNRRKARAKALDRMSDELNPKIQTLTTMIDECKKLVLIRNELERSGVSHSLDAAKYEEMNREIAELHSRIEKHFGEMKAEFESLDSSYERVENDYHAFFPKAIQMRRERRKTSI